MENSTLSSTEVAAKKTVMDIIEHGSVYDVGSLDKLYSENMHVIRVASDGKTSVMGKRDVLNFFQNMRSSGAKPLSTEVEFNHIEAEEDMAHVVVTRSMKMFGKQEKSVYSLCLAKNNSGWKVVKETIVTVA